jgi:hypothetical protein
MTTRTLSLEAQNNRQEVQPRCVISKRRREIAQRSVIIKRREAKSPEASLTKDGRQKFRNTSSRDGGQTVQKRHHRKKRAKGQKRRHQKAGGRRPEASSRIVKRQVCSTVYKHAPSSLTHISSSAVQVKQSRSRESSLGGLKCFSCRTFASCIWSLCLFSNECSLRRISEDRAPLSLASSPARSATQRRLSNQQPIPTTVTLAANTYRDFCSKRAGLLNDLYACHAIGR